VTVGLLANAAGVPGLGGERQCYGAESPEQQNKEQESGGQATHIPVCPTPH